MSRPFPSVPRALLVVLLVGGVGCSVRAVEEDEPPDAEGLCREYCERFLECVWSPDAPVAFDTVEECVPVCTADVRWDPVCEDVMEDKMLCYTSYDCPEFREIWSDISDGPCLAETLAYSNCIP